MFGNYSGLSNTDELTARATSEYNGLARSDPGVSRAFDLPFIGNTAAGGSDRGRLATDRPHVFNGYGAYILDWNGRKTNSTEFSLFQTIQSGSPKTTLIQFLTSTIFTKRGDLGRTPIYTQTDFGLTHRYRFGADQRFTLVANATVLNLWDEKSVITVQFRRTNGNIPLSIFPQFAAGGFPALINAYNKGELLPIINNYLAQPNLNRTLGTYGLADRFQGVRTVNFGFGLQF